MRDGGSWLRGEFFSIMGLSNAGHTIIEVPLAKVTRRRAKVITGLRWYEDKLDALLDQVFKSSPFDL
ncbi:hypothetical protein [Rufibacter sp. LB8]|uniref:hypothetical protein n=1 Tax=Rufibacter sp. LB8 TaxID=2777781 RepID=UPI00178C6DD1|nr:hypothetical protein [Rufibacter sp. LB8]